jgi:hypothetical protein
VLVVALAAAWARRYRPWEAHYKGRPTSWWSEQVRCLPLEGLSIPELPPPPLAKDWLERAMEYCGIRPFGSDEPRADEVLRGDPAAVPVLIELLRSDDPRARVWAAEALAKTRPPAKAAVPALEAAAREHARDFPGRVSAALARGSPEAAATFAIRNALSAIDPEAARRAGVPVDGRDGDDP